MLIGVAGKTQANRKFFVDGITFLWPFTA